MPLCDAADEKKESLPMYIENVKNIFFEQLEKEGNISLEGATVKELHYMSSKKYRVRKKYQNMVLRRRVA